MNNLNQEICAREKRKPADNKCCKNNEAQARQPKHPSNRIRISADPRGAAFSVLCVTQ